MSPDTLAATLPVQLADIHSTPDSTAGCAYLLILLACFVGGLIRAARECRREDDWRSGAPSEPPRDRDLL